MIKFWEVEYVAEFNAPGYEDLNNKPVKRAYLIEANVNKAVEDCKVWLNKLKEKGIVGNIIRDPYSYEVWSYDKEIFL